MVVFPLVPSGHAAWARGAGVVDDDGGGLKTAPVALSPPGRGDGLNEVCQQSLSTDPWLSPVADIADAVLTAQVSGPSPFESLTPALAVVETLVTSVVDALGEAGRRRFEQFGEIAERWVRPWPDGADREERETAREIAADPPLRM